MSIVDAPETAASLAPLHLPDLTGVAQAPTRRDRVRLPGSPPKVGMLVSRPGHAHAG